MIEAIDVHKSFGAVEALAGVNLTVRQGTITGLLGHNGAGKTTLVHILATLLSATSGTARVAGFDVLRDGHEVRRRIGITGQFASLDDQLTGTANLVLVGRLLGADKPTARQRAVELLRTFDLLEAADRPVSQYSGGMRRRLDIAASLVGQPAVLFLDEPTAGLDPVSRNQAWQTIRSLTRQGTTILLTTQDLEEADRLADQITVLAEGRVVASGTPRQLKAQIGRRAITVTLRDSVHTAPVVRALAAAGFQPASDTARAAVTAPARGTNDLLRAMRAIAAAGVDPVGIALAEPTLNDVYLSLSHTAGQGGASRARRSAAVTR